VLVVDDEPDVLDVSVRWVRTLGYDCASPTDGEEAARLIAREAFDILLTDVRLPGLDGFELFHRVQGASPLMSVVMMTGYGTIEQAVTAMKEGVQALR